MNGIRNGWSTQFQWSCGENFLLIEDNVDTHQEQHRCLYPLTNLLFLRIYSKEITHQRIKYIKMLNKYQVTNSKQPKCSIIWYWPSCNYSTLIWQNIKHGLQKGYETILLTVTIIFKYLYMWHFHTKRIFKNKAKCCVKNGQIRVVQKKKNFNLGKKKSFLSLRKEYNGERKEVKKKKVFF